MSLIHEALKKAEQQRRLGEPPSLGTPFARAPQRRSLLPYLAVAIVGALGAGWYLSHNGTPGDTTAAAPGTEKPAVAATAGAQNGQGAGATAAAPGEASPGAPVSGADQRRPTMGPNAAPNPNVVSTLATTPQLNNQAPSQANPPTVKEMAERESEPHPPGANPLAPGEAAPLALGAPPPATPPNDAEGLAAKQMVKEKEFAANAANSTNPAPPAEPGRSPFFKERAPAPAKPSGSANAPVAAAPPRAGFTPPEQKPPPPAPAKPPVAEVPPPKPPVAEAAPPPKPPVAEAATAKAPPPPAPPPAAPAAPAPAALEQLPAYWQLPYNVRKELPELKMSMHVYSATPAQRFVVLNGNRQVEGDELGGDVRIAEIRTDGVVLTFHGQRFLVPRGGS